MKQIFKFFCTAFFIIFFMLMTPFLFSNLNVLELDNSPISFTAKNYLLELWLFVAGFLSFMMSALLTVFIYTAQKMALNLKR